MSFVPLSRDPSRLPHYPASSPPLVFPDEEEMPEYKAHIELRQLLYQILMAAYSKRHSIGSDQFVYWNAANPKRCLAPDGFVRLNRPDDLFDIWKTWEWGAPELCVEFLSRSDRPDPPWAKKLAAYSELGAHELVSFDWRGKKDKRLRVWDRIDEKLVERVVKEEKSPCLTLGLHWVVSPLPDYSPTIGALRLSRDPNGNDLLLTKAESATKRVQETEARLRDLEAELEKRG
jgi:Uma2 family endonuclease